MSLPELEQHIVAYFLANGASQFDVPNRYYPYRELILIFSDKMQVATRRFGVKMGKSCEEAAVAFIAVLLERGAFSTVEQSHGDTMHRFQPAVYRELIKELQETDPIILKVKEAGSEYCERAFASLMA